MKSWEPDQSFEKSDFKGASQKKKSAAEKPQPQAKPVPTPGQPPKSAGQTGQTAWDQRNLNQTIQTDQGPINLQAWQPGQEFGKADIPSRSADAPQQGGTPPQQSGQSQPQNRAGGETPPQPGGTPPPPEVQTRPLQSWQPGAPSSPREARTQNLQKTHLPDGFAPRAIDKSEARHIVRSTASDDRKARRAAGVNAASDSTGGQAASESGFAVRILRELVVARRENTRHILRNWYWEKPGQSVSKLAHVAAQDRIAVVLRAMGKEVLQILFQTMSPTEREQMVTILKKPYNVPMGQAQQICTEFMELIQDQA